MTELIIAETGLVVPFPDCGVCNDTGQVTCPTITVRGHQYLGHGPCECPTCRDWPDEMRIWADRKGHALPADAVKPENLGKFPRNFTILACRFCPNGRSFHDWLHTERKLSDKAAEWKWTPSGWRKVDSRSEEGKLLHAAWKAHRASGETRVLTMAAVERLAKGMFR